MKSIINILLFLSRLFIHLSVFLFVLLPLMIAGAIILPFVLPFMAKDNYYLPFWLRWFDNVDGYVGRDTSVYHMICDMGWWARYKWLAWRNPINYFDYRALGLFWKGREVYTFYNPANDNVGDGTRPGFRHIEIEKDGVNYFEYYLIYRYPFAQKYCCRFRMGWKIGNNKNPPHSISQWVLVFNPCHPYTGK